jgi:hypothetical protein
MKQTPIKLVTHLSRFRVGDRVYLIYAPETTGTVSKVTPDGFRVTYDWKHARASRRVLGRERHWFLWRNQKYFAVNAKENSK